MTGRPPPDPTGFELFNEIGIIDQLAGTLLERALPAPLTRAQFSVLNHFVRLGHADRSPAQLADAFQVTRSTMTSTLARLERAGYVKVSGNPGDGRSKCVSLTEEGRAARAGAMSAVETLLPLLGELLAPPEVETLIILLRKLRTGLDHARD